MRQRPDPPVVKGSGLTFGLDPALELDLIGPLGLSAGMRLVLCSDGLHGVLSDEEIGDALRGRPAVDAAAEVLRAAANAGALDDVSVIVCELADGDGEGTSGR